MRLGLFLVLLCSLVGAGTPAPAQPALAQQCANFGLMQYRRLDPAILRIVVSDFPAPVLERFEAKAGSQPIAAALTIRGQVTYRKRSPIETQFICLFDGAERPVFFYALPPLAARPAPTPLTRGAADSRAAGSSEPILSPLPRAPASPATLQRSPSPASTMRMRGVVRDVGGRLQFQPCDGVPLPLDDRTPDRELTRAMRDLTAGRDGRPLFVEIQGGRDTAPGGGIAALELRRAAVETVGCRERFDQREWVGVGSEPAWRLEITQRDMVLIQPGVGAGSRLAHGGLERDGGRIGYIVSQPPGFRVWIEERRCADPVTGSLFSYFIEVQSEGKSFAGCAAHNPAMPAP